MKLAYDQLDSLICFCDSQIASARKALTPDKHPQIRGSLGGQIKAYSVVKYRCIQRKAALKTK